MDEVYVELVVEAVPMPEESLLSLSGGAGGESINWGGGY